MTETIKIKSVSEGKPWQDLTFYDIVFERNGSDFPASWGRKGDGDPQPGEEVEGEFYKDKKDQWRFKRASKPTGSFGGGGSGGKREWQPETQRDPERSARILRQHSQEMALRMFAMTKPPGLSADLIKEILPQWADFFDQDVIQAAKQGADKSEGAGPLPSPSPASRTAPGSEATRPAGSASGPEQTIEEQSLDAHHLGDILNRLGVIDPDDNRWLVQAWEALNEDKRTPAFKQLTNRGDLEGQNVALKRLWELAGPVPEYFRNQDTEIPF